MATLIAMQTILSGPVNGAFTNRARHNSFLSSAYVPPLRKHAFFPVRCMADQEAEKDTAADPVNSPAKARPGTTTTPTPSQSPSKPKVSTKFSDVFAFSGPAPERINGRLAMIGFVAALGVELSKGQDVFTQISDGSGLAWFLGTSVVLSLASLIPLFRGVSVESKSEGLMTSDAELWNGRFAMLGLVALAFTEFVKGGSLI